MVLLQVLFLYFWVVAAAGVLSWAYYWPKLFPNTPPTKRETFFIFAFFMPVALWVGLMVAWSFYEGNRRKSGQSVMPPPVMPADELQPATVRPAAPQQLVPASPRPAAS